MATASQGQRDREEVEMEDDPAQMIDEEQVVESLDYFSDLLGQVPRSEVTSGHLDTLELVADNGGLSTRQLCLLLRALRTAAWPAQLARRLLYSLVPRDLLPGPELASLCLWALGTAGLSRECVVLPALRLACLCLQYDCVDDRRPVSALYEMFVKLLGKEKVGVVAAELLCLLTTTPDVRRWRVEAVMAAQERLGSQPALDGLVFKYRQLRPDLVPHYTAPPGRAVREGKSALHRRFHRVWEDRVDSSRASLETIWARGQGRGGEVGRKGARETLVPGPGALAVQSGLESRHSLLPLAQCSSLQEVVDNQHRLQLPAQILALLGCRVGVNVLVTEPALVERLSLTLYHTLRNEFLSSETRSEAAVGEARRRRRRSQLLQLLVELQESVQQGLPVIGRFLTEYLAAWDGQQHFTVVLKLISQVQITDFKELYDCLLEPVMAHYQAYSVIQQTVVLSYLGELLRSWATVEHKRFNTLDQGESESIFPVNSKHCENSVQSILELSRHLGELATLSLAGAQEREEDTDLLVSRVFQLYKINQKCMMEQEVPVRLEVPKHYFYASLFSYNASLIDQACDYVLLNTDVQPFLRKCRLQKIQEDDSVTAEIISEQLNKANTSTLNTVARDMLVFLAPGRTEVKAASALRLPWARGREAWLRDNLFLSSHPAFLPHVLSYLGGLQLEEHELAAAWLRLKEEDGGGSVRPNTSRRDNKQVSVSGFMASALADFPAIADFVATFSRGSATSATAGAGEQDRQSVCSQATASTADSGVFSKHPEQHGARGAVGKRSQENMPGPGEGRGKRARVGELAGSRGGKMVERALRERN